MRGLRGDELLRLPVRLRGIHLGRVVDVLLHPTEPQALGVDVLCGDETHRFLPFSASSLGEEAFEVQSPFVLLDLPPDSFYRLQARSLVELRGTRVGDEGLSLLDIVLGPEWGVEELVLAGTTGARRVPLDGLALPARSGWRTG
jgi:hypothetical protein